MKRIQGDMAAVGKGSPSGNHLLHSLALLVTVCIQAFEVTPDFIRFSNSPLWIARPLAWAALFAILGQGLARSRAFHGIRAFLVRRLVRDWVPLACVVLAMAVIVGPLITDRTPRAYATDPGLWSYFANLVGFPQFSLPGVFEFNNKSRTTLGLLWSVPCYLVLVGAVAIAGDRQARQGWQRLVLPLAALTAIGLALLTENLGLRPMPNSDSPAPKPSEFRCRRCWPGCSAPAGRRPTSRGRAAACSWRCWRCCSALSASWAIAIGSARSWWRSGWLSLVMRC